MLTATLADLPDLVPPWEQVKMSQGDFEKLHAMEHTPMTLLGWSDLQLRRIAHHEGYLHEKDWKHLAAITADAVAQYAVGGGPLRYSRDKSSFTMIDPLANPLMTYHAVIRSVDVLKARRDIYHVLGHRELPRVPGRQSILEASPQLVDRILPILDLDAREDVIDIRYDSIQLKSKGGRGAKLLLVPDTTRVRRMREEMDTITRSYTQTRWEFIGRDLEPHKVTRIFTRNFRRNGRLYHYGQSHQSLASSERRMIRIFFKEVWCPTVELDYTTHHINLAYGQLGQTPPPGDHYDIPRWERDLVKKAILRLFNARSTHSAIRSLTYEGHISSHEQGLLLVADIKDKHPDLVRFFGTDTGAKLMRVDSDIVVAVLLRFLDTVGYCPLSVHDSFIVAEQHQGILQGIMDEVLMGVLTPPPTISIPTTPMGGSCPNAPGPIPGGPTLPIPTTTPAPTTTPIPTTTPNPPIPEQENTKHTNPNTPLGIPDALDLGEGEVGGWFSRMRKSLLETGKLPEEPPEGDPPEGKPPG